MIHNRGGMRVWIAPAGSEPMGMTSEDDLLTASEDGVQPATEITKLLMVEGVTFGPVEE